MKPSANKVLQYLFGNESLNTIPTDDLKKLAEESPYFPLTQFFLAEKLKGENDADYIKQAQKAALYFSNPYWFHYQITNEAWQQEISQAEDLIEKGPSAEAAGVTEDLSLNRKRGDTETGNLRNERAEEEKGVLTEKHGEGKAAENEPAIHVEANPAAESSNQLTQSEEEAAAITRDTDPETEDFLDEIATPEKSFVRDNLDEVILETQSTAALEATENLEEMAGTPTERSETTDEFLNEIQPSETENTQPKLENTSIPPFTSDTTGGVEVDKTEPDEHERMFLNIKAMLDATNEEADADVENAVIPIDPYYTIDYFASQGIKLELDKNPKDELGQHLKKFTQWLRHMKKLGPEDATEVINRTDTEADIQKIAESSNTVREVVTEAMASVLEKQGKNDKAIELYKKLSFLNPDKSAYFAAKIKNLKGI